MADADDLQRAVDLVKEYTEESEEKNFEEALRLCDTHENKFQKATKADRNKNYEEDGGLYDSGIKNSHHAIKLEAFCDKENEKIQNKCKDKQYLEKKDQFELVSMFFENEINKAVVYFTVAVKEDGSKNYEKALDLYEKGIVCILRALDYDVISEKNKEIILNKKKLYVERAEKINRYLAKLKIKELDNDCEFDTTSDIFEEEIDIQCCRIC